jgi:antitoxin VapB
MSGRKPKDRKEEEDLNWPVRGRTPESFPTDWQWLDALKSAELDSDLIEAVEERVEDQKRPQLEDLFG